MGIVSVRAPTKLGTHDRFPFDIVHILTINRI